MESALGKKPLPLVWVFHAGANADLCVYDPTQILPAQGWGCALVSTSETSVYLCWPPGGVAMQVERKELTTYDDY